MIEQLNYTGQTFGYRKILRQYFQSKSRKERGKIVNRNRLMADCLCRCGRIASLELYGVVNGPNKACRFCGQANRGERNPEAGFTILGGRKPLIPLG